ncbi:MAG: right-handed parallel beta-helix repeat-containing protein, partial [Phycisphaerae bacterium]
DDGLFCNGAETCDPFAGCQAGSNPCQPGEVCNEATDACVETPEATYEGFGAVTQGAASAPGGYEVYHVTSLADSGPGTLRDSLLQGGRHIVFDVGGTITLTSNLNIRCSYITIDGASAPAPGITIVQPGTIGTTIEARASTGPAHDIIIHHLRMDGQATGHDNIGDIWGMDGMDAPVYNVIIDHVTGKASTDGVFDIYGEVHDVTLSWNLITDTVTALHSSTADLGQTRERISLHHNVFARNNERQIRIRHDNQLVDYVNNVVYGWGWFEGGAAGLHIAYDAGETNPSLNVENNVFHHVGGLSGVADDAIRFERGTDEGSVYFAGNIVPAGESDGTSTSGRLPIPAYAQVTTYPAASLCDNVVGLVGTHYPTADESELLNNIRTALCGGEPDCTTDADCDDSLFCNGPETCVSGVCVPGSHPCEPGDVCNEATDACEEPDPGQWTPPVGIPVPGFGIEQMHTMYAGELFQAGGFNYRDAGNGPYTHYVDNTHPDATDTDNPFGTPDRPRLRLPEPTPAGAVVEVHGGPYSYVNGGDKIVVTAEGTQSSPVFVRGPAPAERPIFERYFLVQGSYIIFENLHMKPGAFDMRLYRDREDLIPHHVAIRAVEIDGEIVSGGIGINGTSAARISNIVVYNNHIHHGGDSEASYENDECGVAVGSYCSNVWVLDNHIHHHGGDSVLIAHGADFSTNHIYVGRNIMHDDRENAVDIKQCTDVVVSQNTMYGYEPSSSSEGAAVVIHYDPPRVWVLHNEIYDSEYGVVSSGSDPLFIIGNIIRDIRAKAIDFWNSGTLYITGNTITRFGYGIHGDYGNDAGHIVNNIITDLNDGVSGYHIQFESSTMAGNSDMHHNLVYQGGNPVRIQWGSAQYTSIVAFTAGTGKGEGCLQVDPRFIDTLDDDFHLQPDSQAIDAGVVYGAYRTFLDLYGINIDVAVDGGLRPQGAGYDIGAYER